MRGRYLTEVTLRSCQCAGPVTVLSENKTVARAIEIASGYWNVYVTFFEDMMNIISFIVVDTADGHIVWRNGRLTQGRNSSEQTSTIPSL